MHPNRTTRRIRRAGTDWPSQPPQTPWQRERAEPPFASEARAAVAGTTLAILISILLWALIAAAAGALFAWLFA